MSAPRPVFFTSAPFACGLAWLVNAMLALGYRTTSLLHRSGHWEPAGDGRFRIGDAAREHMLSHLPVLLERERHRFSPEIEIFWEHRLRFDVDPTSPVVVVVRDPRDALFSLHRRWRANDWFPGAYPTFLDRRTDWPDHFPGLFYADAPRTWALYHLRWMHASRFRPVLFVRFEDLKSRPEESVRQVLSFLHLRGNDDTRIARAIGSSSTERARAVLASRGAPVVAHAIHRGQAFEWKERFDPGERARFDVPGVRAAARRLGYEAAPAAFERRLDRLLRSDAAGLATHAARAWIAHAPDAREREGIAVSRAARRARSLERRLGVKRHRVADAWARACACASREIPSLHDAFARAIPALFDDEALEWIYERTIRHPRREKIGEP